MLVEVTAVQEDLPEKRALNPEARTLVEADGAQVVCPHGQVEFGHDAGPSRPVDQRTEHGVSDAQSPAVSAHAQAEFSSMSDATAQPGGEDQRADEVAVYEPEQVELVVDLAIPAQDACLLGLGELELARAEAQEVGLSTDSLDVVEYGTGIAGRGSADQEDAAAPELEVERFYAADCPILPGDVQL